MLPYFQIGPLRVWTYGLMLAFGLWQGYFFFRSEIRRRQLPVSADALMFAIAVAGIVGAKLYHLLTLMMTGHASEVSRDLFDFAGLAWNGGLIAGFVVLLWFAHTAEVSAWSLLDAASPAAALGYAFGRLGCFFAGDGDYGKPTSLPWGMSFPHGLVPTTERVHPTPLYELIAAVALFAILMRLAKRNPVPGMVFAFYLIGSGVCRFLVEFIRLNSPVLLGLTEAQIVSVVAVIAGAALLIWRPRTQLAGAH